MGHNELFARADECVQLIVTERFSADSVQGTLESPRIALHNAHINGYDDIVRWFATELENAALMGYATAYNHAQEDYDVPPAERITIAAINDVGERDD